MRWRLLIVAGLILNIAATLSVVAQWQFKKTARVPFGTWVEVLNPTPVRSENTVFTFGEHCSIQYGGKLQEIGRLSRDTLLVKYEAPSRAAGAACPTGVVFEIIAKRLDEMNAKFKARRESEMTLRDKVIELLK